MSKNSKKPTFNKLPPSTIISEQALRLVAFNSSGQPFASGTCIAVAGSIVLTAKHVILDYFNMYGNTKSKANIVTEFRIWAIQILNEGKIYAIWEVDKLVLSPHTDIAIIHLRPYCKNAVEYNTLWRVPKLNLLAPPVGLRIVGFGYHSSIAIQENGHLDINDCPTASVGEVVEVHEPFRDRARLNFPCYRVNAQFDGGMSGGPVFNNAGELCGIICSNLPPNNICDEHISYVATLWPLMGTMIDFNRGPKYPRDVYYPFLDLVRDGFVSATGWQRISISKTDDGKNYKVHLS